MQTSKERNSKYYTENKEKEKARSLKYYHENKDKIDREAKRAYMAEYLKTYQRKKPTEEEKQARSARRRKMYATDPTHREQVKNQARKWNAKNPEMKRSGRLKRTFGISLDQYQELLKAQGNKCAICDKQRTGVKTKGKRENSLHVDHCHTTGKVRGILCNNCNAGIGHFKDSPELLKNAILYLSSV